MPRVDTAVLVSRNYAEAVRVRCEGLLMLQRHQTGSRLVRAEHDALCRSRVREHGCEVQKVLPRVQVLVVRQPLGVVDVRAGDLARMGKDERVPMGSS